MLRICVGLHRRDKCQSFINKRPQKQRDETAETSLIEPQTKKQLLPFPYTGCLIGIPIMFFSLLN